MRDRQDWMQVPLVQSPWLWWHFLVQTKHLPSQPARHSILAHEAQDVWLLCFQSCSKNGQTVPIAYPKLRDRRIEESCVGVWTPVMLVVVEEWGQGMLSIQNHPKAMEGQRILQGLWVQESRDWGRRWCCERPGGHEGCLNGGQLEPLATWSEPRPGEMNLIFDLLLVVCWPYLLEQRLHRHPPLEWVHFEYQAWTGEQAQFRLPRCWFS